MEAVFGPCVSCLSDTHLTLSLSVSLMCVYCLSVCAPWAFCAHRGWKRALDPPGTGVPGGFWVLCKSNKYSSLSPVLEILECSGPSNKVLWFYTRPLSSRLFCSDVDIFGTVAWWTAALTQGSSAFCRLPRFPSVSSLFHSAQSFPESPCTSAMSLSVAEWHPMVWACALSLFTCAECLRCLPLLSQDQSSSEHSFLSLKKRKRSKINLVFSYV